MSARKMLARLVCAALLTLPVVAGTAAAEEAMPAVTAGTPTGEQQGAAEIRAGLGPRPVFGA